MEGRLTDFSNEQRKALGARVNRWHVTPPGIEGYRTAEVALGVVDTYCLETRTMLANGQTSLYLIVGVLDAIVHLGGQHFQWAWS